MGLNSLDLSRLLTLPWLGLVRTWRSGNLNAFIKYLPQIKKLGRWFLIYEAVSIGLAIPFGIFVALVYKGIIVL